MKIFLGFVFLVSSLLADMKVYVSHDSKIQTISLQNLKNLYLKKTKLLKNQKVVVYDNEEEYNIFNTTVMQKSDGQIHAYWMKQIFSGRRAPPEKISFTKIEEVLKANPNAICYSKKYLDAKVIYEDK